MTIISHYCSLRNPFSAQERGGENYEIIPGEGEGYTCLNTCKILPQEWRRVRGTWLFSDLLGGERSADSNIIVSYHRPKIPCTSPISQIYFSVRTAPLPSLALTLSRSLLYARSACRGHLGLGKVRKPTLRCATPGIVPAARNSSVSEGLFGGTFVCAGHLVARTIVLNARAM